MKHMTGQLILKALRENFRMRSETTVSPHDAFRVWLKIGVLSFGGPAAQIALMYKLIVAQRQWLTEKQFLNALSFCMLLPGPEAMQLATYIGWKLHGLKGGLVAGVLFVLPGAALIALLAFLYVTFGNVPLVDALFTGIKAAVLVIVIEALLRVSKKALSHYQHWVIAALAFVALFFFNVSYPLIVLCAASYGFLKSESSGSVGKHTPIVLDKGLYKNTLRTVLIWCALWVAPFIVLLLLGNHQFLIDIGSFFSRLAVVTFGGAYAVLAYLAQDVVGHFGWLDAGEMMDALGLAETTPGPLILVTEFVGFLAGYKEAGLSMALAATAMTLWVTFIPCFLWIFAGAPYIDWIGEQPRLKGALSCITAAVVGVMLNLSLWFALHALFTTVNATRIGPASVWLPDWATLNADLLFLSIFCAVLSFVLHWSVFRVLTMAAVVSLLYSIF